MLQIGLLGYFIGDSSQTFLDNTPVYYEPGFNIFSPLEFNVATCDQMYFILRERTDPTEDNFRTVLSNNFILEVTDVTTGEYVPSIILDYSTWSSSFPVEGIDYPALIIVIRNSIDPENPQRVRTLKVVTKNGENNNSIELYVMVQDQKQTHYYLTVDVDKFEERRKSSMGGIEGAINVNNVSDTYLLFSPVTYFKEVDKNYSNFSYPSGSVFYQRQTTYNDENFSFEIEGYSHTFVLDNIKFFSVPNYQKAAVLLVDKHMYTDLVTVSDRVYVDISATGILSDIYNSFRVYFIQ